MDIVDARARPPLPAYLPDRTYDNLPRTLANVLSRGWEPAGSTNERDIGVYLDECASAGIQRAGLPARVPNQWWGGQGNEPVFEACETNHFFFAYGAVDPFGPAPLAEVEHFRGRGARGIVVEPGIAESPAYLDDPRIDPVYGACADLSLPVLVMGGGESGPDISFSDPGRFEAVAVRFPSLKLVNVHGGWPLVQGALGVAFRRQNVWIMPDVYFPNLPGETDYLLAMRTFLQDRFLFASGYPFCPVGPVVDWYQQAGLSEAVLEKVMGANARTLFRLDS